MSHIKLGHYIFQGLTWSQAESYCREHDASLVSLHSEKDEKKLFELILKAEQKQNMRDLYWLGLNDRGDNGYSWSDGSGLDYINWHAGQPENTANSEECSELMSKDDAQTSVQEGWYSDYCTSPRGVICQVARGHKLPPPPTLPPMVQPDNECMSLAGYGEKWYGITRMVNGDTNKVCIMVVETDSQYGDTAESKCKEKGGSLVSIHSRDEEEAIVNILRQHKNGQYWIGLRYDYSYDTWEYSWSWTDGSALDYENYAQNNPSGEYNQFVYIQTDGRWFSTDSYTDKPYVCQKYPQGAPTPSPEPIVSGACPKDWYPYKNRCFKFSLAKSEGVERKNWDDAEKECEKTEGATLAIVPGTE